MFINNQLLIDKWIDQGPTEWSQAVYLEEGQTYPIRLEFYENGGGAVIKLLWSNSKIKKSVIPQSQLRSLVTSIEGKSGNEIFVYPTIVERELFVSMDEPHNKGYVIFNSLGQIVRREKVIIHGVIQVDAFSKGSYFIKFEKSSRVFRFYKK